MIESSKYEVKNQIFQLKNSLFSQPVQTFFLNKFYKKFEQLSAEQRNFAVFSYMFVTIRQACSSWEGYFPSLRNAVQKSKELSEFFITCLSQKVRL